MSVILASGSSIRSELLRNAGIDHTVIVSEIDESAVKSEQIQNNASLEMIAVLLARAKAFAVSTEYPSSYILGADQTLLLDGCLFDKPNDLDEARQQLLALRGKTHQLVSAVSIYLNSSLEWETHNIIHLKMRNFDDMFLDRYLEREGENILSSVGAYKLEGLGAQLFEQIEGDYFSVLGLPLLEVLSFLHSQALGKL